MVRDARDHQYDSVGSHATMLTIVRVNDLNIAFSEKLQGEGCRGMKSSCGEEGLSKFAHRAESQTTRARLIPVPCKAI